MIASQHVNYSTDEINTQLRVKFDTVYRDENTLVVH